METEFELIAKTFQGLEEVLAKELTELGANNVQTGHRMVSFTGDKEMMYRANFALRTAIRILKPIKHFKADSADQVYNAVKAIDWTQYLDNGTSFAVDSVVFSKEFRHSKFVAYKVKDAIVDFFRETTGTRPNISVTNPDLQLNIHIAENDCTLSLDSSGESLHRRGYRQESVEAPLNEVLAAGMILLTGWHGECDLIDPMCGSGTIPIEAALIARGIAPGVFRKVYAFEKWPDFDAGLFEQVYNDDSAERPFEHHLYGYDILQQAYQKASRNVKAAGLSKDTTLAVRPLEEFVRPAGKALMITNPPYGERLGGGQSLLDLYSTLGSKLKHEFYDNTAWVISSNREAVNQIGLHPSERIPLFNGALECEFRKYELFSGKNSDYKERLSRTAGEEYRGGTGESPAPAGERDYGQGYERRRYSDAPPRRFNNARPDSFDSRPRRFDERPRRFTNERPTRYDEGPRRFPDRHRPDTELRRIYEERRRVLAELGRADEAERRPGPEAND